jgi:hypothetical protein
MHANHIAGKICRKDFCGYFARLCKRNGTSRIKEYDVYDDDTKINRKKFGLWIKNLPILGWDYYTDETGDNCFALYILFLNLLSFDWEPKSRRVRPNGKKW